MLNLNLGFTIGADLLGVACMSLILWYVYRAKAAGLSVLICMPLLYISVSSSLDQVVFFAILPISTRSVKDIIGFSDGPQKALVIWGTNLSSSVGERFTHTELARVILVPYTRGLIVGLLLSDGWISFASKSHKNARLGLKQSLAHSAYVWFVFNQLSHYCSSSPCLTSGIRAGKQFFGLQILTRAMPCIS